MTIKNASHAIHSPCLVLGGNRWKGITERAVETIETEAKKWKEKQKTRYEFSKSLWKHWGNTPAGHRRTRLLKLREKAIRKETDLIKLEAEETEYREEERRRRLSRAKKLLFFQKDPIKSLNSAFLAGEAFCNRQRQIEIRKKLNSLGDEAENQRTQMLLEEASRFREEEEEKKWADRLRKSIYRWSLIRSIEEKERQRLVDRLDHLRYTRWTSGNDPFLILERKGEGRRQEERPSVDLRDDDRRRKEKEIQERGDVILQSLTRRRHLVEQRMLQIRQEGEERRAQAVYRATEEEKGKRRKDEKKHLKDVRQKDDEMTLRYSEVERRRREAVLLEEHIRKKQIKETEKRKMAERLRYLPDRYTKHTYHESRLREGEEKGWKKIEQCPQFLSSAMKPKNQYYGRKEKSEKEELAIRLYARNLITETEVRGAPIFGLKKTLGTIFPPPGRQIWRGETYRNVGCFGPFSE
ncbi:cilia- and flagella- associated protein 210-like isoform X1 [Centruroides vittatus]|uniref:cilia- and flagella- associated protein 210-like isoform X1 n=1 Tax=Centruroides vittatus TaxID=120091 RepID=UPI0035106008